MIKYVIKHLLLLRQMNNVRQFQLIVLLHWMVVLNKHHVRVQIMKLDVLIWLMVQNVIGMVNNVY